MEANERRAKLIHGQPMNPCPECASWNFKARTPIKMEAPIEFDAKKVLGAYARAMKAGPEPTGEAYYQCFGCGHKGPNVDCSDMSYDEIKSSRELCQQMKDAWNSQRSTQE